MPELYAISDLHIGHPINKEAIERMVARPDDWLILAGDVGETLEHLEWVFRVLSPKWARLVWVPGNHELWTLPSEEPGLRGLSRYLSMVELCRTWGVLCPEDPFVRWPGDEELWICPLFLLYDYSFCPEGLDPAAAVAWAREEKIFARDEELLDPEPWPSRQAWCGARLESTSRRLAATSGRKILINHWPLRQDLVRIWKVPRYAPWCGTKATENWHRAYDAEVVVSGHLHMPATDYRDGVRFEEVSLGYPRQWSQEHGAEVYLRRILPAPAQPGHLNAGPFWHWR